MSPKAASCPICGQPSHPETRPFCGKACRDRDLLQWLGEGYSVPGAPASDEMKKSGDDGVDSTPA
ncbi:DNA gyrase inhibitor YacG [Sphingobium sp.]|uniref:DNA gyrase inhibitor YacG n=1 Tax=Sphingobium sp. TaxID=1912891 RepID=UPI0028BF21B4|nr:DNA gyrase inhibitor YacG [Sphingobium sp.]